MAPRVGAFLFAWLFLAGAQAAQVERALDGDSLLLKDGRQVRLIGVNAPEFGRSCHADSRKDCIPTSDQPLARAAQRRLANLVEGKRVRLEPGREEHDRHGRLLAHVYVADTSVEEILLREGLAWQVAIPPNVAHATKLQAAETEARSARRGVWSETAYAPVEAERLRPVEAANAPSLARGPRLYPIGDTGFRLVAATVRAVRPGNRSFYLELAARVVLIIPHEHWKEYFAREAFYAAGPAALTGKRLVARGWLSERDGELRLRVGHPAMLTWLD
jgi:endonuclease YncB( thermonuclease family)